MGAMSEILSAAIQAAEGYLGGKAYTSDTIRAAHGVTLNTILGALRYRGGRDVAAAEWALDAAHHIVEAITSGAGLVSPSTDDTNPEGLTSPPDSE